MASLLLALQAFLLYYAMKYGVLVGPVQWDDTAFISRAVLNLHSLANSETIYDLLRHLKNLDIHAPLSDLQTMFGLTLAGGQIWLAFALNAALVLPPIYVICRCAARFGYVLFAALLIFILFQPLTINALLYIKSDWKGGLFIAAALLALYESVENDDKQLRLVGAGLLGLSVLSKLTAFYQPFLAVIVLIAFEFYFLVRSTPDSHARTLRMWASAHGKTFTVCVTLAILPYCMFFLLNADRQIRYIRTALSGRWEDAFSMTQRAIFYSPFNQDGATVWGTLHWAFLILAGGATAVAIWQRRYRYLIALAIVLFLSGLFLVPLIYAGTSNLSFSATLIGIIAGGTLISVFFLVRTAPRWCSWPMLAILAVLMLNVKLPLSNSAYGSNVDRITNAELRDLAVIYKEVAAMLDTSPARRAEIASIRDPRIIVFFQLMYAPERNLTYLRFHEAGDIIRVRRIDNIASPQSLTEDLANAEFALTIRSEGPERSFVYTPGGEQKGPVSITPDADRLVDQVPSYTLINAWELPSGSLRLYRNSAQM